MSDIRAQDEMALASVKVIYDAAQAAQADADRAKSAADDAESHAQTALTNAASAKTAADNAQASADAAITQLSIIEDVAGTLDWIQKHGTYTLTTDTTVQEGTVYFVKNGNDYEPVVNPTGNPRTQGWYVLDISNSQSDYIMAHLAVTSRGLWVLPSGMGSASDAQYAPNYKALLSSSGLLIYDGSGNLVSTFGENITFSATRGQRIGGANNYIEFDPSTGRLNIVGSGVYFGTTPVGDIAKQSDIPTNVSELNNDSGYQTATEVETKIDESNLPILDDLAATQEEVSNIDDTLDAHSQSISSLQSTADANTASINTQGNAISSLQSGQTEINTNVTNLRTTTQNLDDRTSALEGAVVIDPSVPSVSVVSGDGSVRVTSAKVVIRGGGNSTAWGDSESFNAQKGVFTEIRPRTISISGDTATFSGNLVFMARSNGHVSLKRLS